MDHTYKKNTLPEPDPQQQEGVQQRKRYKGTLEGKKH